jgi:hypothetical protein
MTLLNKAFAIFSVFCGLAACGPDGGNASTESGPGGSAASSVDGETQPSAAAKAFIGPWTYASGTENAQCGTAPPDTQAISPSDGTVTFTAGPQSDQLIVDDSGCIVLANVAGNIATGTPGVECPGNFVINSLIYTLTNGTLQEQGNAQFEEATGDVCNVTDDAYLLQN